MRCKWFAVLLALVPLTATAQQAASFDCRKAATVSEKMICQDRQLSALDGRIARAYGAKLKRLPPSSARVFRQTQQYFLSIRDARFAFWKDMPAQAMSTPRDTLETRLKEIEAVATRMPKDFSGTWSNNSGSWWIKRRADGRYDVAANGVEPINARGVCSVAGIATVEGNQLLLKTGEETDADHYALHRNDGVLAVTLTKPNGEETSCGVAATLQGDYLYGNEDPAPALKDSGL